MAADSSRIDIAHEAYHRARGPVAVAGPCPERGRASDHDPDPVERQARGGRRPAGPDRHRHGPVAGRPRAGAGRASAAPRPWPRTPCSTSSASCPTAARSASSRAPAAARSPFVPPARCSTCRPCRPTSSRRSARSSWAAGFTWRPAISRRLIDKTRFAISTEETRYYLNGIHVHATKGGATSMLRGVATDGHRLARVEVALPDGAEQIPAIIVPRKTVGEVRKLIEGIGGEVEIGGLADPDPVRLRACGAGLAPDRRHLPRLRAGDPDRQREDGDLPRRRARAGPSIASPRSRPRRPAP